MITDWRTDITGADITAIHELVAKTGVFSPEEIDVAAELAEARVTHGDASGYHFILAYEDEMLAGYTCFGRIPLTDERYDLYWIVVDPARHNRGVATALLTRTEDAIRQLGGHHLYAETSSRDAYAAAQTFYLANSFGKLAHLPDFYKDGDGKIIYGKKIEFGVRGSEFGEERR